jgi:DNA (cytosine-5)-methyltransferase 1
VLSDLATIGYNAEWQCLQNNIFGFPHERERIYLVAYRNGIGTQGLVSKPGEFKSIFRLPKKTGQDNALFVATWVKQQAESRVFGDNDRLPNYVDRVTAIGNTVNPFVAEWLFNCIKNFENENTRINSK